VPYLLEMLGDSNIERRVSAVDLLVALGPRARSAVPALTACLDDKEPRLRAGAAHALRGIGRAAMTAVPKLEATLHDQDAGVVGNAARALLAINPTQWQVPLRVFPRLVGDEYWNETLFYAIHQRPAKRGVARAIAQLIRDGEGTPAARRALAEMLARLDPQGAFNLLEELVDGGCKDVEPVLETVRPPSLAQVLELVNEARQGNLPPEHKAFARAEAWNIPAIPALMDCLDEKEAFATAAVFLGNMGPAAESATPALIASLRFVQDRDRKAAIAALAQIGLPRPQVVAALAALLDDAEDVEDAAKALATLGPGAAAAVPRLEKLLATPDAAAHAADALCRIAGAKAPYVAALIRCLDGPQAQAAATALARLGTAAQPALPALRQILQEKRHAFFELRAAVAEAIGNIGPNAAAALPALLPLLDAPYYDLRNAAVEALGNIGDERTIPRLVVAVEEDETVAEAAELALSKIRLRQRRR
jgi:HEAT repeat protein